MIELQGDIMSRNDAARVILEDYIDETPMEARIARIESDVAHIKGDISSIQLDLRELRGEVKGANSSIADLKAGLAELKGELKAQISGLDSKIIRWIVGTVVISIGTAFSIARFVS